MVSEADGRIGGWAVGKTNIPRAIKPPIRQTAHPLIVHSPIDTPYSVRFLSLLPLDRRHPCAIDRQPGVRARALLADGQSRKDVADRVAEETGISRNRAYRLVNEL